MEGFMRRLLVLSFGLGAIASAFVAGPASATCMDHVDKAGVRIYSCAPPGGPVTMYVCVHDTCVPG